MLRIGHALPTAISTRRTVLVPLCILPFSGSRMYSESRLLKVDDFDAIMKGDPVVLQPSISKTKPPQQQNNQSGPSNSNPRSSLTNERSTNQPGAFMHRETQQRQNTGKNGGRSDFHSHGDFIDNSRIFGKSLPKTSFPCKANQPDSAEQSSRRRIVDASQSKGGLAIADVSLSFATLGLPKWLVQRLDELKYLIPTAIQRAFLQEFSKDSRRDLLMQAQTGTGKSIAYIMALLSTLKRPPMRNAGHEKSASPVKHIIMVPNSLLAGQLYRWLTLLVGDDCARSMTRLAIPEADLPILNLSPESTDLSKPAWLCIATANVLRIELAKNSLDLSKLETLVMDEADYLVKALPKHATINRRQSRSKHPNQAITLAREILALCRAQNPPRRPRMLVASATLNRLTRHELIKEKIVKNATEIYDGQRCPKSINHFHRLILKEGDAMELIESVKQIIEHHEKEGSRGILFVSTKDSKAALVELLVAHGLNAKLLSSVNTTEIELQAKNFSLLVASDIDARGMDFQRALNYVIVVNVPESPVHYLHMAGRVGRMGRPGSVYTLLAHKEEFEKHTSMVGRLGITSVPMASY